MTAMEPVAIVRLDGMHFPRPEFSIPHSYTEYPTTSPSETSSRIRDAQVVITTRVPLLAAHLASDITPNLKIIAIMAAGTNILSPKAYAIYRERGIKVCN